MHFDLFIKLTKELLLKNKKTLKNCLRTSLADLKKEKTTEWEDSFKYKEEK